MFGIKTRAGYQPSWIPGRPGATAGARAMAYDALELPLYDRLGGGKQVFGQLMSTSAGLIVPATHVPLAGYGGIITGQIFGQPLVDPSAKNGGG